MFKILLRVRRYTGKKTASVYSKHICRFRSYVTYLSCLPAALQRCMHVLFLHVCTYVRLNALLPQICYKLSTYLAQNLLPFRRPLLVRKNRDII